MAKKPGFQRNLCKAEIKAKLPEEYKAYSIVEDQLNALVKQNNPHAISIHYRVLEEVSQVDSIKLLAIRRR